MEFVWHDGGRASCGYVGTSGDCVTRSITIATGEIYRDVYESLSVMSDKTARHGISDSVSARYLTERGWRSTAGNGIVADDLPKGVVIVGFKPIGRKRTGHMSCLIDHTVYDTWNPLEDPEHVIESYWTCAATTTGSTLSITAPGRPATTDDARLTQQQFDRILQRVKALHRTASNSASTEGEIRNALRAMQALVLEHNLSRSDIVEDDDVGGMRMTQRACPLNGSRACQWESSLAFYLTEEVFPTVQFYQDRKGHRTLFWFYGPLDDVQQALELFREMLLTIATSAQIKYRGHARGRGASYAEGYVDGLPRIDHGEPDQELPVSENSLVHTRMLVVHSKADQWLNVECGIRLHRFTRAGRGYFDASAHRAGKRDGAKHEHSGRVKRKRIAHYQEE